MFHVKRMVTRSDVDAFPTLEAVAFHVKRKFTAGISGKSALCPEAGSARIDRQPSPLVREVLVECSNMGVLADPGLRIVGCSSAGIVASRVRLDHCEWQLLVGSGTRVRRSKQRLRRCTVDPLLLFLGPGFRSTGSRHQVDIRPRNPAAVITWRPYAAA